MNIFKQFWLSLYSPKDIAKFRFQGIGKTILYVFLLVLLSAAPSLIYSSISVNNGVAAFKEAVQHKLPDFEIKNGTLHTEAKEPVEYKGKDFSIYLDSTGSLLPQDIKIEADNALGLLISEIVIVSNGNIQTQPYTLFNGFTITHSDLLSFMDQIDGLLIVLICAVVLTTFIFSAGLSFIEITFLAFVAKMLASTYNPKLEYRHYWRLTAYCTTLPTLFFTIMGFLQTNVIGGVFVSWAVTFTMLFLVL